MRDTGVGAGLARVRAVAGDQFGRVGHALARLHRHRAVLEEGVSREGAVRAAQVTNLCSPAVDAYAGMVVADRLIEQYQVAAS